MPRQTEGWKGRRTKGWKGGQTLFHRTLPTIKKLQCAGSMFD